MLGSSSTLFDGTVRHLVGIVQPNDVLELGCGVGKFGEMLRQQCPAARLTAVQKMFASDDRHRLESRGYANIVDADILDYYRTGFDERYNLIVALDVIEHFLYSDVLSIINFSLYRADYMLLVWPSAHPQAAETGAFDRHRASFGLKELANLFDVVFYAQSGFAQMHVTDRYHVALLRGFMNVRAFPPLLA